MAWRAGPREVVRAPWSSLFLRFQEANDNAANALLKTLEEAPPYVVLILTADGAEGLLPTIASRCEILRLRPTQLDILETYLKQQGADKEQARLLSHISGGRPGAALRLMQDPSALASREEKLNELRSLLPASRLARFAYGEKLARDKDGMRGVLLLWLSFWRDVLLRAGGASTALANIDRVQDIESIARRIQLSDARRVVSDLERSLTRLEANVNARLLVEVLLLDWPKI